VVVLHTSGTAGNCLVQVPNCFKVIVLVGVLAGVSNFGLSEMQELLKLASVKPAVLEMRSDPFAVNHHLINFCLEHNLTFIGYSTLGTQWINSPASINPVLTSALLKVRTGQL